MKLTIGDQTQAEALRIAERHLSKMGWKYTPADVAKMAVGIIVAMNDEAGRAALEERGDG